LTNAARTRVVARARRWHAFVAHFAFLRRFVEGMEAHNAFEAAAAIAFWFFLSLVPLLVLLGFMVGRIIARAKGVNDLLAPVLELVPGSAEDIVRLELERISQSSATVAPVGVVGYMWTASSGLHNLMDVFETAVKVQRRSWWVQRAIALGWVIAGLAAACALAWALVRVDHALHLHETAALPPSPKPHGPLDPHAMPRPHAAVLRYRVHEALSTPVEQLIASALMLLVGTGFLAGFYRFAVVHPAHVRRRVWPGAVTAVLLWLVVSWVFGLYAVSVSSYAVYYGSLAAVAVLLVWLYLTSLSLVVGAELNAQLEGVRAPAGSKERSATPSITSGVARPR
jgi:membrane protein